MLFLDLSYLSEGAFVFKEKMKLSIIIPHYKEPDNVVFPLLASIDIQLSVEFKDIEVIIVNDGPEAHLSKSMLNVFANIKPIVINLKKNKGMSAARNIGFDRATGDYVMFCDADDRFHNAAALWSYMQCFSEGYDYIAAPWLGELINFDGSKYYETQKFDATGIHAKMFRRQFLIDRDIKFLENFRCHEDTYFTGLAYDLSETKKFLDFVTYVWCANVNSMTRENAKKFHYEKFHIFHQSVYELFTRIEKDRPEGMPYRVTQNSMYVYFYYQSPIWDNEGKEYLKSSEAEFAKLMKRFYHYMENCSSKFIEEVFAQEREKYFQGYSRESYKEFIKRILTEY